MTSPPHATAYMRTRGYNDEAIRIVSECIFTLKSVLPAAKSHANEMERQFGVRTPELDGTELEEYAYNNEHELGFNLQDVMKMYIDLEESPDKCFVSPFHHMLNICFDIMASEKSLDSYEPPLQPIKEREYEAHDVSSMKRSAADALMSLE